MYCQVCWPILEIGALHLTHPSARTHTHTHTHGAVGSHYSSTRGAVGGSVPCSRAPQSWYWRWRECCSFTIPTFNSCRTWDLNPQPLDYKSDSLTTRPRLPPYTVILFTAGSRHQMSRHAWPKLKLYAFELNIQFPCIWITQF